VCTICVDYLTCADSMTITCGHTFHSECIHKWKEQSSTCPQCRVKFKNPIKLYFEQSREDRIKDDPAELRNEISELNIKLRVRDSSIEELTKEKNKSADQLKTKERELKTQQSVLESSLGTNDALKKQLTYMEKFKSAAKNAEAALHKERNKVHAYHNIQALMECNAHDIDATIRNFADNPDSFNQIGTSYVFFKKEYDRLKEAKRQLEMENRTHKKKADACSQQLKTLTEDVKNLDGQNKILTQKISQMESVADNKTSKKQKDGGRGSPRAAKRMCFDDSLDHDNNNGSLQLFDDSDNMNDENDDNNASELDAEEADSLKIADEFGLQYVATTSLTTAPPDKRPPLKDVTRLNKNSFATKMRPMGGVGSSQGKALGFVKSQVVKSEKSDLAHFKRGFNGMGGHSKTLVIPKRPNPSSGTSALNKLTSSSTTTTGKKSSFNKIPRNNTKITQFCASSIDLT